MTTPHDPRANVENAAKRVKRPRTVHMRSLRLFVNAGMDFPACYANAALLDMDKGRLLTTNTAPSVTCKRCRALLTYPSKQGGSKCSH